MKLAKITKKLNFYLKSHYYVFFDSFLRVKRNQTYIKRKFMDR
jgi:hypothetical protein